MKCEHYGTPADVYSYAIMLWETASLRKPFSKIRSVESAKRLVLRRAVRPPLPCIIDDAVQEIVKMSWHPDPNLRPSFSLIVHYLKKVLADKDSQGMDHTFCRRNTCEF